MDESKIITQLSIFVNNEPGRLANVCKIIKSVGIRVRAFNLAESAEFGILRAIVENPDDSFEKLREKGIIIRKTDIIAIAVTDAADSFFEAADVLGNAGVNIEYLYAFASHSSGPETLLVFRFDDAAKAERELLSAGMSLVSEASLTPAV